MHTERVSRPSSGTSSGSSSGASGGSSARSSFWIRTLETARQQPGWMLVPRYYTQATAAQITSDIVNASHRHPSTVRVKGIRPGELWEARWAPASDGPAGDHVVWIRLARRAD